MIAPLGSMIMGLPYTTRPRMRHFAVDTSVCTRMAAKHTILSSKSFHQMRPRVCYPRLLDEGLKTRGRRSVY